MDNETGYVIRYNRSRFPIQPKREDGSWGCRGCGGVIPKGRSAWCSKSCCTKYHPAFVISEVRKRDKEVCAICNLDLNESKSQWMREKPDYNKVGWGAYQKWVNSRPKVNYDHVIPFSEGGLTVLENMRTLCEPCHKSRTKDWHKERSIKRKTPSGQFVLQLASIVAVYLLSSCNHLTVSPPLTVAHSISFSGNEQNGGVINCDKLGCIVTPSWMEHYRKLEKANKNYIGADKDIKAEGVNWRISYECLNHFLTLRQAERGA